MASVEGQQRAKVSGQGLALGLGLPSPPNFLTPYALLVPGCSRRPSSSSTSPGAWTHTNPIPNPKPQPQPFTLALALSLSPNPNLNPIPNPIL